MTINLLILFISFLTLFATQNNNSTERLITSLKNKKLDQATELVKEGADINGFEYSRPLLNASQNGDIEVVNWLLKNGVNINSVNNRKSNALMMASYYGQTNIAEILIKKGIQIDYEAPNGYKSFDYALESNQKEIMKMISIAWLKELNDSGYKFLEDLNLKNVNDLIKNNSVTEFSQNTQSLALVFSLLDSNFDKLKTLLDKGFNPNVHNMTGYAILPLSTRFGNMIFLKYLIEDAKANIHIGNDGNDEASALHQAARAGNLEAGKYLIKNGISINKTNARNYTALAASTGYNNTDFAIMLLEQNAKPDIIGFNHSNALDNAFLNKNIKVISEIFFSYLKKEYDPKTLQLINQYKNNELVKFDLESDFKLTTTFLNLAVLKNDLKMVKKLINRGIDLNQKASSGYYPLSLATAFSNKEMVSLLLNNKAHVNAINSNKYYTNPLIELSRNGDIEIAKLLLKYGAEINYSDINNDHALNWATLFAKYDLVKYLLDNGADHKIAGNDSQDNALDIAKRMGFPKIYNELKKRGAVSNKK
jgi:ankyrin repeat protein